VVDPPRRSAADASVRIAQLWGERGKKDAEKKPSGAEKKPSAGEIENAEKPKEDDK